MKLPCHEFPPSETCLLGISGGRDSVALLGELLAAGYRPILCHLNHRLRGADSDSDAAFIEGLARKHDLPVEIGSEDVAAKVEREKLFLEAAARAARFAFFERCATAHGTRTLFLAHHADDQVETIFINLIRGSGPRGLSGMEPVSRHGAVLTVVRPFLDTWRDDLPVPEDYREDASNTSDAFLRNRIRHQVLPALREAARRDFRPALLRAANIGREDDRFLTRLAEEALAETRDGTTGGLCLEPLRKLDPALLRRVLLLWLQQSGIPDCGFREVESIRALLEPGARTAKVNLPGGAHARRREKRVFLEEASSP